MEEQLYSQLNACLQKLSRWTCSLDFPDNRCPSGSVDLLQFADYNSHDRSLPRPSSVVSTPYPSCAAYRFDEFAYSGGAASEGALKTDIITAARQSGYSLVVEGSHSNKSRVAIREVRLACSRGRSYQGSRLDQLSDVANVSSGVVLCGVKSQPLRRSKGKSRVAFARSGISSNNTSNIDSDPSLRKTYSYRPTCKSDSCPFHISVFLSADNFWYVRLSQIVYKDGQCHRTHLGHPKLICSTTSSRSSRLSEEEKEKLQDHSAAHLSSTQSTNLFNLSSNHNLLPYQVKYMTKKASTSSSKLTADASSADQLLSYLDNR